MDAGLLVARTVFGLVMAAHGSQKLFGWFGGYGLAGTGGFFESLGFRPGRFFAALAGSGELFGGLLLALGFLGPVGPALVLSCVAFVHKIHFCAPFEEKHAWSRCMCAIPNWRAGSGSSPARTH